MHDAWAAGRYEAAIEPVAARVYIAVHAKRASKFLMPGMARRIGAMKHTLETVGWVAFGLFGVVGVVLVVLADGFQIVDSPQFGVLMALCICAAIATLLAWVFEGASTAIFTLAVAGMVGGAVWVLITFGYIPAINASFGDSAGRTQRVNIHKDQPSRKGLLSRRIRVHSWRGNPDGEVIHARSDILDGSPTHIELTFHSGGLGFEWISSVKPVH